jgi:ppGpp synthetase/RelA/SpoT-type nucleotidyltranferase
LRQLIRTREQGEQFDITPDNLFLEINDLGGLRLLHLHTRQFGSINTALLAALIEEQLPVVEGPTARTWDDETRDYFTSIGVQTQESKSLYTSVHYVVESNSRTKYTCEIQVRTLAEELWDEVSHTFNYPTPTRSIACNEQVKVLARITSGCSRLVDSIFKSREEYVTNLARQRARRRSSKTRRSK